MKTTEFRKLIREEVRRVVKEASDSEFSIKDKLNSILFGKDEKGIDGYLSQEWRLKREINPTERKKRIELVIKQLNDYSTLLRGVSDDESTFIK